VQSQLCSNEHTYTWTNAYSSLMCGCVGTTQVAVQQASCVAWNIHADINGNTPINFRYQVAHLLLLVMCMVHDASSNATASAGRLGCCLCAVAASLTVLLSLPQNLGEMLSLGDRRASLASSLFGQSQMICVFLSASTCVSCDAFFSICSCMLVSIYKQARCS
jgi:hypothetical protein